MVEAYGRLLAGEVAPAEVARGLRGEGSYRVVRGGRCAALARDRIQPYFAPPAFMNASTRSPLIGNEKTGSIGPPAARASA
ncbi:uncharacterized protein SOCE836_027650 [Sorangium cellulosum]|uniref:Uncharacterized protein n=1 Tax=Sorangium cellulosum TaxID=56 RepID=A0A4P2QLG5_SORCE|nr:uncharacterized protein SOCE836_027650 [Sorangium cellulosum]WCQ90045.1 hypothetical protein NQZ70_02744 [Sorangium sp. Soce836]